MPTPRPDIEPMPGEQYWKVAPIARRFQLPEQTIYDAFASGELDGIRIGRSIRILASSVEDFIDRHRVAS